MATSRRPPSGMRAVPPPGGVAAAGIPPGAVARRPPTGYMAGAARPGSRAGSQGVGALGSQIKVAERPVTQQGLGGIKTAAKGPVRQVQDKTYYMGLLRAKIQELSAEVAKLSREIESYNQESASYLTFEKRAEQLAGEIRELQGEMADYNTLLDKLNTDTEMAAVQADTNALQMQNEHEERSIDAIFAEKQSRESEIRVLEEAVESERRAKETVVSGMQPHELEQYRRLKAENIRVEKELAEKQAELERLAGKVEGLEEEVATSELKQEAFRLHQQLSEAVSRREEWREKDRESPQQERERLLLQVRSDNLEITSIEKKSAELQERLSVVGEQLRRADHDLEEQQGERSVKYRELKKREIHMKEFLATYDENRAALAERVSTLQNNVVGILQHISESMAQSHNLPSTDQYREMQADLDFKEGEREKSEATAMTLDVENTKLKVDLMKIEELEGKISAELSTLKEDIETMTTEIEMLGDLQGLHTAEEERRELLSEEKDKLLQRQEAAKQRTTAVNSEYVDAKKQLEDNDTYTQLGNLERKWQHHEQNNFVMKEYIATKQSEGNYQQVATEVSGMLNSYNSLLCQSLSGAAAATATSPSTAG